MIMKQILIYFLLERPLDELTIQRLVITIETLIYVNGTESMDGLMYRQNDSTTVDAPGRPFSQRSIKHNLLSEHPLRDDNQVIQ